MNIPLINEHEEAFRYLFELQASGRTNMFGATDFLIREQGLDKAIAREVLLYWMQNHGTIARHLGIEI